MSMGTVPSKRFWTRMKLLHLVMALRPPFERPLQPLPGGCSHAAAFPTSFLKPLPRFKSLKGLYMPAWLPATSALGLKVPHLYPFP